MCFIAGTMVMSAQGAVPIKEVRPKFTGTGHFS
jgi:hypothetical protein